MVIGNRDAQQLERLTFFSDAVFAIAMTLLVIEVRLPPLHAFGERELGDALLALIPNYVGFLVSFLVLGRFWVSHHTLMSELRGTSVALVWTNLFLLLAVAFMPFPTAVVSEYVQLRVGVGFYAGWLLLLGFINQRLFAVAAPLRADDIAPAVFEAHRTRSWIPLLIGGGALAAGMVTPLAGLAALIGLGPIVTPLVNRRAARQAARAHH